MDKRVEVARRSEGVDVDLAYANPGEVVVDKFTRYMPSQISQSLEQAVKAPKVARGLRSVLTTVVFKKKDNWTPAKVSRQARSLRSVGILAKYLKLLNHTAIHLKYYPKLLNISNFLDISP